jgi:uncharacterized protein (TIGR02246 family)
MNMDRMKEKRIFVGMMAIAFCVFVLTPVVLAGPVEESVQMTQEWIKAFHEGNAEALSALFAKDAVYISFTSPFPAIGREAIRAAFAGFFRAFPIHQLFLRDEFRKAYGDTVIYNCNWTFIYGDGKGPIKTVYGRTSSANTVVEGKRLLLLMATSSLPIAGP